jgi:hypothetical protein
LTTLLLSAVPRLSAVAGADREAADVDAVAAARTLAGDSIIGHLAFDDANIESPRQSLKHRLSNRLRQMAPQLLELQRRMRILAARGGTVDCRSDIDFLLEIE